MRIMTAKARNEREASQLPRSQVSLGNALAEAISLPIFTPQRLRKAARNEISQSPTNVPKDNWERGEKHWPQRTQRTQGYEMVFPKLF
jgi:hypothetical protein